MPAEVAVGVTVVVDDVVPLEFTSSELRSELEATFASVAFRNETLERVGTDKEGHLEGGGDPSRIDAGSVTVGGSHAYEGLDEGGDASDDSRSAEGALIDTEGDATVSGGGLPLVGSEALATELIATRGQRGEDFLHADLVAELLDDVGAANELVVHASGAVLEGLAQQGLAQVAGDGMDGLEVELADGRLRNVREGGVDGRLAASEALREAVDAGVTRDKLHAGTVVEVLTDVGVVDRTDELLEGVLGHRVGTLEGGETVLHANLRAESTLGAQRVAILGGGDVIGRVHGTAEVLGGGEGGSDERVSREGLLLDHRANGVRGPCGKGAASEEAHEGRVIGESLGDLANKTIRVFGGEIRCGCWC